MSAAARLTFARLSRLSAESVLNPYKQQQLLHQQRQLAASPSPQPTSLTPLTPGVWQLGCWSRDDPLKVMSTLYTLLRKYNFEWKVLSLYKLKARFPAGLADRTGRQVGPGEVCKIGIQLYRSPQGGGEGVVEVGSRDALHQLDVHKLYGQMFLFLDLTANLLTDLAQQVHIN